MLFSSQYPCQTSHDFSTGFLDEYSDYLRVLLYEYAEIEESLDRIRLSATFISSFRLGSQRISKVKYLRYHFECYLSELYIFELRIIRFLRLVEKRCKQNSLIQEEALTRKAREAIVEAFKNVALIRGRHVHLRRYSDKKIEQLEHLDLITDIDVFSSLKDLELKKLQKKFSDEVKSAAKTLEDILNRRIGEDLGKIIFVKLPTVYKARSKKNRSQPIPC